MPEVTAVWQDGLEFSILQDGHEFTIDGPPDFGGNDAGPRPKNLLLTALAGCTGMDVVSILGKMGVKGYGLSVVAGGDYTEEHPRVFRNIHIDFMFTGRDLPLEKLERAVFLSQEKYCGVTAMLLKATGISHTITVNEPEE